MGSLRIERIHIKCSPPSEKWVKEVIGYVSGFGALRNVELFF